MKPIESFSVLLSQRRQDVFLHSFWVSSFHSHMLLQEILVLSLIVSLLKSVRLDFSIFSAVMSRLPALCLTWYRIPFYTHHLQGTGTHPPAPDVHSECDATRYAITCHYLGLVNVDEYLQLTRSRRYTNSCSSASKVAKMMSSAQQRFVTIPSPICSLLWNRSRVPSSSSPLGCWTSTEKRYNLDETILTAFPLHWP